MRSQICIKTYMVHFSIMEKSKANQYVVKKLTTKAILIYRAQITLSHKGGSVP